MAAGIGVRVIRGVDWVYKSQDGGDGHLGTVIRGGDSCQPRCPPESVIVQWDNGGKELYRAGHDKAYDLRIVDSAPSGIIHGQVWCDGCGENEIRGVRWRCTECYAIDLCTHCYMGDRHDVNHVFMRVQSSERTSMGPKLPPRMTAEHTATRGIFPGARVVKYPSWIQRKSNDCGPGRVTVDKRFSEDRLPGQVIVAFEHDLTSSRYHLGLDGQVDLCCTMPGFGAQIYHHHLPSLGEIELIKLGDKVVVTVSRGELEVLQQRHGRWEPSIGEEILKVGVVIDRTETGDLVVRFQESQRARTMNPGTLKKLHTFCGGQTVRVSDDIGLVRRFQGGHGGWTSGMKKVIGKVGRIVQVDGQDVHVRFDDSHKFIFNAISLTPERVAASQNENPELDNAFLNFMRKRLDPNVVIVDAVESGETLLVRRLLDEKPDLVNYELAPRRTLLQFAIENCELEMVKLLVERGAFIESESPDGATPLMVACVLNRYDHVEFLLERGADVYATQHQGGSSLHVAAAKGHFQCVHYLLLHGSDMNLKDNDGLSPLYLAIRSESRTVFDQLMERNEIDLKWGKDTVSAFHFAATTDNIYKIRKLIEKAPGLGTRMFHGTTPLMAAIQARATKAAEYLIQKTECKINAKNSDGNTVLTMAIASGYLDVIEVLVRNGASCNIPNKHGNTGLQVALNVTSLLPNMAAHPRLPFLTKIKKKWKGLGVKSTGDALLAYLVANGADLDATNCDKLTVKTHLLLTKNPIVSALTAIEKERGSERRDSKKGGQTPTTGDQQEKDTVTLFYHLRNATEQTQTDAPASTDKKPASEKRVKKTEHTSQPSATVQGNERMRRENDEPRDKTEVQRLKAKLDEKDEELSSLKRRLQCLAHHFKKKITFACGHDVTRSIADLIPACPYCSEPISGVLDLETNK